MTAHKHILWKVIITCGVVITSLMAIYDFHFLAVVSFNTAINLLWIWEA